MTRQVNGYQDRVRRERDELKIKLDSLSAFVGPDVFDSLPQPEQLRIESKAHCMLMYLATLGAQIAWFDSLDE